MMLAAAPIALASFLHACAPNIGARTMAAIVRVESGGSPFVIHDNRTRTTLHPRDVVEAAAWANQLMAAGHSVDLGLSQINSDNLPRLGLSVREAFDPCLNVRAGATILASNYRAATRQFGAGQYALRRAIGAYNSGSLFAGYGYITQILRAAGVAAESDFRVPDLARVRMLPPSLVRVPTPILVPTSPTAILRTTPSSPFSSPILVTNGVTSAMPSASPAATASPPMP